jgi:hypothetical protein
MRRGLHLNPFCCCRSSIKNIFTNMRYLCDYSKHTISVFLFLSSFSPLFVSYRVQLQAVLLVGKLLLAWTKIILARDLEGRRKRGSAEEGKCGSAEERCGRGGMNKLFPCSSFCAKSGYFHLS